MWSLAIRRAIVDEEIDLRSGLAHLPADSAKFWTDHIDEAQTSDPARFTPNGWVVSALQAAWSAIAHTPELDDDPSRQFGDGLVTAITIGNDTDTVAAIAGALLGARWVRPRSPSTGVRFSTATRACVPTISCNSPTSP